MAPGIKDGNTALTENLRAVRKQIEDCARKAGRNPNSVRLLAVSKTFPAADIAILRETGGQTMFGENRVQELAGKAPVLPQDIEWHLIGHLQSNKAAKAAELAAWIHSVDSEKLITRLENSCATSGKILNILLEFNWTGEETKTGIRTPDTLRTLTELALASPHLRLQGLMTMAEPGADKKRLRQTFAGLRMIRDRLQKEFNTPMPELSMGMSADFQEAILEGATIVRIGSAIFGHR